LRTTGDLFDSLPNRQDARMAFAHGPLTDDELTSAVELLRGLIPADEFSTAALEESPHTVYTTLVTLWLLTLQRLGGGASLAAIVKDVLRHSRELLPDNKRVREGTLSERSGSYSRARTRLPLELVRLFAQRVSDSLIERAPPTFAGRRTFVFDGTTFTLAPTSPLREVYPPAVNQHGASTWPVLLLTVAHELQSGCALIPEFGPMYGPRSESETSQAARLIARLPPNSLLLTDAGFGIFGVLHAAVAAGHDVLSRLTKVRFQALARQAERLDDVDAQGTVVRGARYRLAWKPSAKDRKSRPDLPGDACLQVELHEIARDGAEPLYLVTTLGGDGAEAARLYARRYDVEHDIRDLKVTLELEKLRSKSDEMVRKELLCGLVAYNLVQELRRAAAAAARVEPRRLSFTGVWTTMQSYLLRQPPCAASEWQARYERALRSAAQTKLPNRPGRSYPRQAHPRRPKSTKYENRNRPPKPKPPPDDTK